MAIQLLSDTAVKAAKPADKPVRLNDGGGLYLLVQCSGAKWWRFDYSIGGKRKTLSLGVYPDVPLSAARARAADARWWRLAQTPATRARKPRTSRR